MSSRRRSRLAALALLAGLAGCSTMEVSSDYDPSASFADLATYDWLDTPKEPIGDPRIDGNTLLEKRIHAAVDAELAARGYTRTQSDPDFLVAYHVSLDKRRSVQVLNDHYGYGPGWGYTYGAAYRPGYYAGTSQTYVYEYEEGTLILDVVEPESRQLIWRGSARDEVHFKSTPERDESQLREAVTRMLERFPPQSK